VSSATGPASFIATASHLQLAHTGSALVKFADDTYMYMYVIVAAINSDTSTIELMNVRTWAEENNLKLNCLKSKEIVFTSRGTRGIFSCMPGHLRHRRFGR